MRRRNFVRPIRRPEPKHKINRNITSLYLRVVGDNVEQNIYALKDALDMSRELGLDLVEINPKSDPPICKIIDYSKFLFDQKKKEKQNKRNSANHKIKEIKFGPNTDTHDFDFKLNHAKKFLEQGHKVKMYVQFKGRQISHKERGEIILLKFLASLEDQCKVEQLPRLEGRRMTAMIAPKK